MFKNTKNLNRFFKYHFFFFFLFFGYLTSYLIFGSFTLFYIDRLDNEIVWNHILGNFYRGESDAVEIFLNGETKIYWLRRLFHPFSLLYVFNTEFAYWFLDILSKIVSYLSFYILAKKFTKNYFIVSLSACLFASMNSYSVYGVLIAAFPYFVYLILFRVNLNFKHYLITILTALNSEIVHSPYFFIFLVIFLISFNSITKQKIKNLFFISLVFYIFVLISNSNILYAFIFDGPFHREEIERVVEDFNFYKAITSLFYLNFLWREEFFTYSLAREIPFIFYTALFFPLVFFSKNKEIIRLVLICLSLWILYSLFISYDLYITRYWNPGYYFIFSIFIYSFIFLFVLKTYKKIIPLSICLVLLFQINSNFVPLAKKYVKPFKVENFRNYYSFKDYYLKESYSKIKKIVRDEKVISLWNVDPMVAVMNGIYTLDGEHNLYPLAYKKKFYKIIKKELDSNSEFRDYYLKWGHRVYAFVSDPENVKIDFLEAKRQGANFVISKYQVKNINLRKVSEIKGVETLFLYEII